METFRPINVSLAVFVAVCFFLPWIQVSCGGAHDTESGFDLARNGERLLWLIPLLMIVVVTLGLGREWKRRTSAFALSSLIAGIVTVLLMNRERSDAARTDGLLAVTVTAWFWLAFAAAIVIAVGGLLLLLRRPDKT